MKKKIPSHGKGIINVWEKGESGNILGRPRKFMSYLKHEGYTKREVKECMEKILALTHTELYGHMQNNNKEQGELTVLEQMLMRSVQRSMENRDLSALESILNRTIGKPKEETEEEDAQDSRNIPDHLKDIASNDIEAAKFYQEMMKKQKRR